jgi:hypothetical protein
MSNLNFRETVPAPATVPVELVVEALEEVTVLVDAVEETTVPAGFTVNIAVEAGEVRSPTLTWK